MNHVICMHRIRGLSPSPSIWTARTQSVDTSPSTPAERQGEDQSKQSVETSDQSEGSIQSYDQSGQGILSNKTKKNRVLSHLTNQNAVLRKI